MKNLTIFLLLISTLIATELDWVNKQIQAIKPQRIGLDFSQLSTLSDPFVNIKKIKLDPVKVEKKVLKKSLIIKKIKIKKNSKKINFNLSVTLNKSARINKKWYKLGEYINGYKIVMIESSSVLLIKNKHKIMLSTVNKNNNISFQN